MDVRCEDGVVVAETHQARVGQADARRALDRVIGMSGEEAVATLTFSASTVCEPLARLIDGALVEAWRALHVGSARCVVSGGSVSEGEPVTRVRRQAHGLAAWITTETTRIRVELTVPVLRLLTVIEDTRSNA